MCFWLPYSSVNNYTCTAEHAAIIKTRDKLGLLLWRRGWDSNPRDPCEPDSFQDCSLQPLGHLSIVVITAYTLGRLLIACQQLALHYSSQ